MDTLLRPFRALIKRFKERRTRKRMAQKEKRWNQKLKGERPMSAK